MNLMGLDIDHNLKSIIQALAKIEFEYDSKINSKIYSVPK
jgi:hypothetical protein